MFVFDDIVVRVKFEIRGNTSYSVKSTIRFK